MGSAELLLRVLYWHAIPSMTTVVFTLGAIILLTRGFQVRSPRWLYWLFWIPLVKGFFVLVNGVHSPPVVPTTMPFAFGIRLWDPLNLVSIPSAFETLSGVPSAVDQVTIGVLCLLILALVWRWVSLFTFYRSLGSEELYAEDAPRLFRVLDRLVDTMGTRHPRVAVSAKPYMMPCIIGVPKPTLVLSPELAEESSDDILEAILSHELAHLKRHDNWLHWISVVLRDVLALNPFVHMVYPRLATAKEQDCDRIASDITGKPKAMAQAIASAAAAASREGMKPLPGHMSGVTKLTPTAKLVNERLSVLLANTSAGKQKVHWAKGSIVVILAFLALLIQFSMTRPSPLLFPVFVF